MSLMGCCGALMWVIKQCGIVMVLSPLPPAPNKTSQRSCALFHHLTFTCIWNTISPSSGKLLHTCVSSLPVPSSLAQSPP